MVANFTLVGDHRSGPAFPGPSSAVNLRNGTAGTVLNSVLYFFKLAGLKVDVDETWRAHCAAIPTGPAVFCDGTVSAPIATGGVFVVSGAPNPFRQSANIDFTLPQAGHVNVEIYGADGRRVQTLVDGDLPAGPHSVPWHVGRTTPSGMYFYRVLAGAAQAGGKLVHVD
jgi:hypothetical protein